MNDTPKLPALTSGGSIRAIVPTTFEEAWRIANAVVIAGMAPKDLSTPEKATVAILHGMEVGLPPMAALQSIAIINGRPCIWGDGALGLVQGSGRMQSIKEWVEGEGDKKTAYCRVLRHGDAEPKLGKFSVADAKLAKLWGKTGSQGQPTPWVTFPERMLQMRARSWALRDGFADVLKGLAIAEEYRDIEHDPDEKPRALTPPKPPKPEPKATKPSELKPPKPTLSQPVKAAPMPPVNGQQDDGTEQDSLPIEGGTNEALPMPGDLLSALDADLTKAKTEEEVEEVYDRHDLEAVLQTIPQGEEFIAVAIGIKNKHANRVNK